MYNISLRQIKSLIAIQRYGKISIAAKSLGLTSPAITLQLKQLEDEIGEQLFIRTRDGAIPTEMGEVVIRGANRIMNDMKLLEESIEDYKGTRKGGLSLGVVSTGKYFLPRIIAAFGQINPGIEVKLITENRSQIIEALQNYEIDIALMGTPPKHFAVKATQFSDHPFVFIANPNHPLASQTSIKRQELIKSKIIVRELGSGTRAALEIFLSSIQGGEDFFRTEMQSNETIKQSVMADLGIALISGHTIEFESRSSFLKILDVEGTPIKRRWFSVYRTDRTPTPAMTAFEAFLQDKGKLLLPRLDQAPNTVPDQ